jgi:transcriptional regulator with XRE-family HTH domain
MDQEAFLMPNFGDRLRRLRGDRSQREVAGLLEMPVTTYSTLENQDNIPRGQVLKRLADFFAVPMSYFHSTPSPELRSTDAARGWLEALRTSEYAEQKTVAHADFDIPNAVRSKIAERIKAISDAKASDKR